MIFLLRKIKAAMLAHFPAYKLTLLMDALPLHLKPEVLLEARSLGIHVVLVPAKLTFLLQPLDAYVFVMLKRMFRSHMLRWYLHSNMPPPSLEQWIRILTDCLREHLIRRDWKEAFEKTGFGHDLSSASRFVQQYIPISTINPMITTMPSHVQLRQVLPSNRRNQPFELFEPSPVPLPAVGPAPLPVLGAPLPPMSFPVLMETALTAARAAPAAPVFSEAFEASPSGTRSRGRGRGSASGLALSRLALASDPHPARARGRGRS